MLHPTTKLLNEARAKVQFPLKPLTQVLYGNERIYELYKKTEEVLDQYPEMINDANYFNLSRRDQLLGAPRRLELIRKHLRVDQIDEWVGATSYHNATVPGGIFFAMVIPAIRILGTDEQIKRWEQDCLETKIIAAYVQTELAHGSDVQGLQTTATFDRENDQFIINTPQIEATKYWPGELGIFSNWALTYAVLVVDGKSYGVHPFMVQIRDTETHLPLSGITVGDIGPKLGFHKKDNGFLQFNNVKIPRSNMLQRYTRIDRDGTIHKQGNEKVSYSAMMIVRKLLIYIYGRVPAQALTIAIRYSIVRQQFRNDQGVENSILEYQSQQDKLLPLLAKQYAVMFGGLYAKELVEDNFERVKQNDFSQMQLTHAILSGCKANYTYFAIECYEWCRLSCGGHGFTHSAGFAGQTFDLTPNITLEGENKILLLQLTRYLFKILQLSITKPEKIPSQFQFLKDTQNLIIRRETVLKSDITSLQNLKHLLQQNVASVLVDTANKISELTSQGLSFSDVWNFRVNDTLIDIANAFMEYFNFNIFYEQTQKVHDASVKRVLSQLCQLLGIQQILQQCPFLIDNNLIGIEDIKTLKIVKEELLKILKDQAIGLVDAFEFNDNHLKSLIGCYDGQPYERMLDWAQNKNILNKKSVADGILHLRSVKPKL